MNRSAALLVVATSMALAPVPGRAEEPDRSPTPAELVSQGRELIDRGHPDAAIGFLEEAVSRDPSLAEAYMALGDAYALCGRAEKAVEAYEKFLALSPLDPRAAEVARYVSDHRPRPTKGGKS